ncbi:hypothetical protein Tco_0830014 [Tanacetum coccineum]
MVAVNDVPQLVDKKGGSYAAIAPKLEPGKFNIMESNALLRSGEFVYDDNLISKEGILKPKRASHTTPLKHFNSTYCLFSNNVIQDFQENSDDEVDERSSEEYLRDLDIEYHERALLANSKRFIKRRNNFSVKLIQSFRKIQPSSNSNSQADPKFQEDYKAEYKKIKAKLALLVARRGLNEEEVTQVKVLMALADDELTVGKSHARNVHGLILTIKKQNGFELTSLELNLLMSKQAKLDVVTFQIQLTKLNHALQEQLKEKKKINEKWLTSSKKVSQCIIPASMGYDQEMVPKTKDWVERLNPNSKLPNFNTGRILVPESQAVNESLEPTETLNTPESSKDLKLNPLLHYVP